MALANETGKDVWINIPVGVDNDYITKIAQLLAYGSDGTTPYTSAQAAPVYPPLNTNLKVYLEYGNELWNGAYAQSASNASLAAAAVAAGGSPLNYDGSTDSTVWTKRRVVDQTVQISSLFRAVWGDANMITKIRPVFEWQYANSNQTAAIGLSYLEDYYDNADGIAHVTAPHPANYYLYGGGAGWYLTPNSSSGATVAAIYASGETSPSTEGDAIWALGFGLHEMGYEGGFEVGGDSPSALQLTADLDPNAETFETNAINKFYQLGGGNPFVFNRRRRHLLRRRLIRPSPTRIRRRCRRSWPRSRRPGPPAPSLGRCRSTPATSRFSFSMGVTPSGTATGVMTHVGDYISWPVVVQTVGNFTITTDAPNPATMQIRIDGVPVGTGTWTGALGLGLHGIMVRNLSGAGTTITKLVVTKAAATTIAAK